MKDLASTRMDKGLTQLELAARSTVHNDTLSRLEAGKSIPQRQVRKTLEAILCQRINWLATSGTPAHPPPVEWEDCELSLRSAIYQACGLTKDELKSFIQVLHEYTYTLENLSGEIEPLFPSTL